MIYMTNVEHPDITRMNRYGYLRDHEIVEYCKHCNASIREGQTAIHFHDDIFCDEECLIDAFCDSPKNFGAEKIEL